MALKSLKDLLTPEGLTAAKVKRKTTIKPMYPGFKAAKAAKVKIKTKVTGLVPLKSLFA